jgi:hypothetical protein
LPPGEEFIFIAFSWNNGHPAKKLSIILGNSGFLVDITAGGQRGFIAKDGSFSYSLRIKTLYEDFA